MAGMRKLTAEPGHDVYKLTPEQLAAWRRRWQPLTARWAAKVRECGDKAADGA